jgi:voltage-gated potassium channel
VTDLAGDRRFRLQGPALAIAFLVLILASGTLGYHLIEGWTLWHSFYVTVAAIATVELPDISPRAQPFTIILLFSGISAALYTFTLLATLVVEGGLGKMLQRRRYARMLETIRDHFIICGYGRIGSTIAEEFRKQNVPFVVIDRMAERIQTVLEYGGLAVEADASREEVLVRGGIHRARGLIAAVGTDAENVYAVLSARVLRPDLFIIARVESEDAEAKLRRAGADRVISPYQLGAVQMAATALRPAVVDFMRLATTSDRLDLSAEQIEIGQNAMFVGQTLRAANFRQAFGVVVVAIKRADGHMQFNPAPDDTLQVGDQLVVLGNVAQLRALEEAAASTAAGAGQSTATPSRLR